MLKYFLQRTALVIKKVKGTVRDLNGEEIVGIFYEKQLQKTSRK